MTYKFSEVAKVSKGNKKTFEPNILTKALADKIAAKDILKGKKGLSKVAKKLIAKIPLVTM